MITAYFSVMGVVAFIVFLDFCFSDATISNYNWDKIFAILLFWPLVILLFAIRGLREIWNG